MRQTIKAHCILFVYSAIWWACRAFWSPFFTDFTSPTILLKGYLSNHENLHGPCGDHWSTRSHFILVWGRKGRKSLLWNRVACEGRKEDGSDWKALLLPAAHKPVRPPACLPARVPDLLLARVPWDSHSFYAVHIDLSSIKMGWHQSRRFHIFGRLFSNEFTTGVNHLDFRISPWALLLFGSPVVNLAALVLLTQSCDAIGFYTLWKRGREGWKQGRKEGGMEEQPLTSDWGIEDVVCGRLPQYSRCDCSVGWLLIGEIL